MIKFSQCKCEIENGKFDINNIHLDCPAVWRIIGRGNTVGVFQLEKKLGQDWSNKVRPKSIEELAALISLLRPGPLEAEISQNYVDVKFGKKEISYIYPSLEPILSTTYGQMTYQEQALKIATDLAGFSLEDADNLRKCVTGDTLFLSKQRGWVSINTLLKTGYLKDLFSTMDECGNQKWKKISSIWSNGVKTTKNVETRSGFAVKATKNHQFLTSDGWKARQRIKDDDYLVATKNISYDGRDEISSDFAVVIAGIIAGGCLTTNKNKYASKIRQYIGYTLPENKKLPETMMGMTVHSTKKFLSFILACNGVISKSLKQFEYSSKSIELVRQLKLLLLRFGIRSSINSKYIENHGTYFGLYICNCSDQKNLLNNLTDEWPEHKRNALISILKQQRKRNFTTDIIPHNLIIKMLDQYPYVGNCESGANLPRHRFANIANKTNDGYWIDIANNNQIYDQVKDTGSRCIAEVYDFSMEDGNTPYIMANGLIIHNSIGKKKPELMAKLKTKFIDGAQKHGNVPKDIAAQIFGWIEKCQRYSFNKCVSGSTVILRGGKGKNLRCDGYTVEHMYNIRNSIEYAKKHGHASLRRKWNRLGHYGYGWSLCDDGRIRPNIIRDIRHSGTRKVFTIKLSNGSTITTTDNHKFPTPNGEKKLDELVVGDKLLVCGQYEPSNFNLINRFRGYPSELVEIIDINEKGAECVWDVTMDGPNHNFVTGNKIVTCNSHGVSYAMIAYQTAYLKCHFPLEFFTSYLTYSHYKSDPKDEIYKLVQDARLFNINIFPPDIRRNNVHFEITDMPDTGISFGLSHIRGVGESAIQKIINEDTSLEKWCDFLSSVPSFHRNVGIALIKSGACDCYNMSRTKMVKELETILGTTAYDENGKKCEVKGLTSKEKEYFFARLKDDDTEAKEILLEMAEPPNSDHKSLNQMKKNELCEKAAEYFNNTDFPNKEIIDGDSKFIYTYDHEKQSWIECLVKKTKSHIMQVLRDNGYKDENRKPPCANEARRQIMRDKADELSENSVDDNRTKAMAEKHFLGISLSCSPADDADSSLATHTCLDIAKEPNDKEISVCAIIDSVKNTKTKKGKNPGQPMCFLTISDSTYSIDHAVVFPNVFDKLKAFCKTDLICLIRGAKRNGSFIVDDMQKLI